MRNIQTTADQTVGGVVGHVWRRLIHMSMVIFPIIYYIWGARIALHLDMMPWQVVLVLLGLIVVLEMLRITKGFIAFGQRQHEADQISSFAWGTIAMAIVLIFSPAPIYAIPIVAGCAIGDPVVGELRGHTTSFNVAVIGMVTVALIWWLCSVWMIIPWWLPFIMGPITIAAEWPNFSWFDDNALMMLVPLAVVWMVVG
jgi:hypothetical protein